MARQCLELLYAVWTGQMTLHYLAGVGPRTSLLGGQWLRLQQTGAETRDGSSPPHRGREDPLPLRVQGRRASEQGGRVSGGPCWRCFAGWRETASRRPRARCPRRGLDRLDLRVAGLALQQDEMEIEGKRKHGMNYQMRQRQSGESRAK